MRPGIEAWLVKYKEKPQQMIEDWALSNNLFLSLKSLWGSPCGETNVQEQTWLLFASLVYKYIKCHNLSSKLSAWALGLCWCRTHRIQCVNPLRVLQLSHMGLIIKPGCN